MRRIACEHDKVYSGQINLSQRYAFICRRCGECSWDTIIDISRVNADEYYVQRVAHGWATPQVIPPPPRVPVIAELRVREPSLWYASVVMFALSSVLWLLLGANETASWSTSFIGSGLSLLAATVSFVRWKSSAN